MKFLGEIQARHRTARENCNIRTVSVFVPKNSRTIHPQRYASGLVTTSKDVYAIRYERSTTPSATGGKKGNKKNRYTAEEIFLNIQREEQIELFNFYLLLKSFKVSIVKYFLH